MFRKFLIFLCTNYTYVYISLHISTTSHSTYIRFVAKNIEHILVLLNKSNYNIT
jgi:hypothetical protein